MTVLRNSVNALPVQGYPEVHGQCYKTFYGPELQIFLIS